MPRSFVGKIIESLHYAYIDMMESVGKWLVVGLFVAGLITVFVPDTYFEVFKDNSLSSMLLVLCISIPMYLCATGSIPIAVALMMKGLTPGAALVLLMAGPACSVASILVVSKVLGRRTLMAYLFSIATAALALGMGSIEEKEKSISCNFCAKIWIYTRVRKDTLFLHSLKMVNNLDFDILK